MPFLLAHPALPEAAAFSRRATGCPIAAGCAHRGCAKSPGPAHTGVRRLIGTFATRLAVALGWLAMDPSVDPAEAAVAFRAVSCAQSQAVSSLVIPVPSGTTNGDLLVASVGVANSSAALATPSGWTQVPNLRGTVGSGQELVTWYRFASASEPATYTFTATSGTDSMAGGISAFSGASPTTPIAAGAAQTIQNSLSTSDTLPNATATRDGSIRYSTAGSDDLTVSTYPGMNQTCDEGNEGGIDISTSTAWEATNTGTTTTRSVNRTDNAHSVLQTLVISPPPCGTGSLGLTPPSAITFPGTVLNGLDQTRSTTTTAVIDDQSSAHAGWSLSATSTTFTNGSWTLPTSASRVTGASATAGAGNCSLPTNGVGYPVTVPAGTVAPAATKIFGAAASTGAGPSNLDLALSLAVPANTHVGTYSSTWTFTVSTGP